MADEVMFLALSELGWLQLPQQAFGASIMAAILRPDTYSTWVRYGLVYDSTIEFLRKLPLGRCHHLAR